MSPPWFNLLRLSGAAAACIAAFPAPGRAQDPATIAPAEESPGTSLPETYQRPDLTRPLLDLKDIGLDPAARESVVANLSLLVRNFPGEPKVTWRLRSRALGLALRLVPDHRDCLIANGQLARGVEPQPLTSPVEPKLNVIADALHEQAVRLLGSPREGPKRTGRLLMGVAAALDWDYAEELVACVPPDADLWLDQPGTRVASVKPVVPEAVPDAPVVPVKPPAATISLPEAWVQVVVLGEKSGASSSALQLARVEARLTATRDDSTFSLGFPEPEARDIQPLFTPAFWNIPLPGGKTPTGAFAEVSRPVPRPLPSVMALAGGVLFDCFMSGKPANGQVTLGCGAGPGGHLVSPYPLPKILEAIHSGTSAPRYLVIAQADEQKLVDWLIADRSRWQVLCRTAFLSAGTIPEAIALARGERTDSLERALKRFDALALNGSDAAPLRTTGIQAALAEVLHLFPGHVSASVLLRLAQGKLPRTLVLEASIAKLDEAFTILKSARVSQVTGLQRSQFAEVWDQLSREKASLPENVQKWLRALMEMARLQDRLATSPPPDRHGMDELRADIEKQRNAALNARALLLLENNLKLPPER